MLFGWEGNQQAWRKVMAAYLRVDGLKSPQGWLPVHRDQLRAQRLEMSMRKIHFTFTSSSLNEQHISKYHLLYDAFAKK